MPRGGGQHQREPGASAKAGSTDRGVLGEGRAVGSVQVLLNLRSICNAVL